MSLTPAQCRAARALIGWSQDQLAAASDVAKATIANFETGHRDPYARTLDDLQRTLEKAGVIFVEENGDGPGVRLRRAFAEMTKARTFTQTYEVKVRLPGRASPSPTGKEFPTQEQAEAWIESAAGRKLVDAMLVKAKGGSK